MRSVEEALEIYFFSRLPPPMAEALEEDLRDLKISRENYLLASRRAIPPTACEASRAGKQRERSEDRAHRRATINRGKPLRSRTSSV